MNENELMENKQTISNELTEFENENDDDKDDEYDSTILKCELYRLDCLYQQKCKECEALEQQISLLSNVNDEYADDGNNENINTELQSYSKDITLIDEIETLKNKIQVLESEKRELEYQVQHYQNYAEELEDEKMTLEETISNMNDIKTLDNSLNTNYEDLLKENQRIKEENEKYKTELKTREKEIEILQNEIENTKRINILKQNHNDYQEFIRNKINEMKEMLSDTVDINRITELTNKMVEISKQLKEKEDMLEKNEQLIAYTNNQLVNVDAENAALRDLLTIRLESNSFNSVNSNDIPYSPSIGSDSELNENSPLPNININNNNSNDSSMIVKNDILDIIKDHISELERSKEMIDESDEKRDKMEEEINRMNKLMEQTNQEVENIEKSINEIRNEVFKEINKSKQNLS